MTATASATRAYQQRSVLSATKEQLLVMLYEGCSRFLRQAAIAMRAGQYERSNERIQRGQAIIDELRMTLDMEQGGEIATNLRDIYLFCNSHLTSAVFKKNPDMVEEVARLMAELGETWDQLSNS